MIDLRIPYMILYSDEIEETFKFDIVYKTYILDVKLVLFKIRLTSPFYSLIVRKS